MRKHMVYLCVAELMAFFAIAACGVSKSRELKLAEIADFEVEEVFKSASRSYKCVTVDDGKELYTTVSVWVQWPERLGDVDISAMQDSIVSMISGSGNRDINRAIIEYVERPEGYGEYELTEVDMEPAPSDSVGIYSRFAKVTIESLSETMAIIKSEMVSYTGGAHNAYASSYCVFDFTSGKADVVEINDLFELGSGQELLEVIKRALKDKYDLSPEQSLDEAGLFSDYIYVTDDIYLDGYNVVFHYDPYEIGPWVMGVIDVEVPYYAVAELLTPAGQDILIGKDGR